MSLPVLQHHYGWLLPWLSLLYERVGYEGSLERRGCRVARSRSEPLESTQVCERRYEEVAVGQYVLFRSDPALSITRIFYSNLKTQDGPRLLQ
jgi:hypothetical protein